MITASFVKGDIEFDVDCNNRDKASILPTLLTALLIVLSVLSVLKRY